jgi:winged helix DNA-binding protein
MDTRTLRAWWWHRQGLDGSLAGATPAQVLERSGWARSVGGCGPYLTLFSRAGIGRERADEAVAALEICELPAVRGCTYVVPASDFALALKVGQPFSTADMRTAEKLGVGTKEIDRLCDAVVQAVSKGPLEPDEIRSATGKASRSLGPEGVKRGLATTLPVALARLQAEGLIRRVPTNGRLDQQRYRYAAWRPSPLAKLKLSLDKAHTELARRYFRWIGPATVAEFAAFAGLGAKAGKAAVEPIGLVPMEAGSDRLMFADDREALASFQGPNGACYALVSGLDGIVLHRRDPKSLLDERDALRKVMADEAMQALGGLSDLPSHALIDRGRLVGLWEHDPEDGALVWASFVGNDNALLAAVERTERFVRDDLGDARSFSLDSPKSRAPRIAALRRAR